MTLSHLFSENSRRLRHFALDGLIALAIFGLATFAVAYRVDLAPDIFTDEIIYTRMAVRVGGEGALVWDSGQPFLVHPPLFFMLQGWLTGISGDPHTPLYAPGDIFSQVAQTRLWNAVLAGLTAVLFYGLGVRLHSRKMGLLMVALFALDPFGVRINRRAMLETLAGVLSLAGILSFLTALDKAGTRPQHANRLIDGFWRAAGFIPAGLLLGAALLSKELTFTTLFALALYGAWEYLQLVFAGGYRPRLGAWLRHVGVLLPEITVIGLAALTYTLYPVWVWLNGDWADFSYEKMLGLRRLVGLVHLSGWNRPGVSILDFLMERLQDYGSTYLVLALGGAAVLGLLIWGRGQRSARLLIAWGAVLYPTYAFMALAGSGNDQFFYFLLLPALALTTYAALTLPGLPLMILNSVWGRKTWGMAAAFFFTILSRVGLPVLLAVLLPYNMWRWWVTFGSGLDNGYQQFTEFVQANLPAGEAINATGDPIKFYYFLPEYVVYAEPTPAEAMKAGIHYFALSPKDVQFHFGKIQPELGAWIEQNGQKLFAFEGSSYGEIFLYRVDYPGTSTRSSDLTASGRHWRSFRPAHSGFVAMLSLGLFFWVLGWLALANLPRLFDRAARLAQITDEPAGSDEPTGPGIPAGPGDGTDNDYSGSTA